MDARSVDIGALVAQLLHAFNPFAGVDVQSYDPLAGPPPAVPLQAGTLRSLPSGREAFEQLIPQIRKHFPRTIQTLEETKTPVSISSRPSELLREDALGQTIAFQGPPPHVRVNMLPDETYRDYLRAIGSEGMGLSAASTAAHELVGHASRRAQGLPSTRPLHPKMLEVLAEWANARPVVPPWLRRQMPHASLPALFEEMYAQMISDVMRTPAERQAWMGALLKIVPPR